MSSGFRLLDLFCGAGGAAAGYVRAGFEVVGVDIKPQPRYLLSGASEFVQADALEYCREHGHEFDAIHASPPCQAYSIAQHIHGNGAEHPDLVANTREALCNAGAPWVIENVPGAPLRAAGMLCGRMFGLRVLRHRHFECSAMLLFPPHPRHPSGNLTNAGRGYSGRGSRYVCVAGNNFSLVSGAAAMGIDWMTRAELAQAIPPAYTEYIGKQLIEILARRRVAV